MTALRSSIALTAAEQQRIAAVEQLISTRPPAVEKLTAMLTDPSWSVRREVVRGLGTLGTDAVSALCELLATHRDNEARIAAVVDALAGAEASVLNTIAPLAAHRDPAVVADVAQVLGRRREPGATAVLTRLVGNPDDNVAVAAIEALGRIGGPEAIDALVAAVKSDNFFRIFPAIDVLGRIKDPRVIPPLSALLDKPIYAFEAARALGKTGEAAAVAPLSKLLSAPSEAAIRVAAVALADLHARHSQRYGSDSSPEAALRRAPLDDSTAARLTRALQGAAADEQLAIAFVLGVVGGDAAVAGLRTLIDVPGPVGETAAAALKRLGKGSDTQVREALSDPDSRRRRALLPIVGRAVAVPELLLCLDDEDPVVRALACEALARVGAADAVERLFGLLGDSNQRVWHAAQAAIQSLGSTQTRALAMKHAQSRNPAVRLSALRISSYFAWAEAFTLFAEAAKDPDSRVRDAALTGLALSEVSQALKVVFTAAGSPDEKTRASAMRALGHCLRKDASITETLLTALRDPASWVRYYACQALGRRSGPKPTQAIAALLNDSAGQVRVAAVEALSRDSSPEALSALQQIARGGEADMQRAALVGLGTTQRPEALPVLTEAALAPEAATRLVAISALAQAAAEQALPVLTQAVADPDENVRAAAVSCLGSLPGPKATAALLGLLHDERERERVISMLSVDGPGRVEGLVGALSAADDALAVVVTSALARLRTKDAHPALLQAMSHGTVAARKAAAASLAASRTPEAMAVLQRAAEKDPDPVVRQVCAVLLSQ
ncbi:MAG: HEAT repeat domain-containing protein [Myxococcaceae bacterium]